MANYNILYKMPSLAPHKKNSDTVIYIFYSILIFPQQNLKFDYSLIIQLYIYYVIILFLLPEMSFSICDVNSQFFFTN